MVSLQGAFWKSEDFKTQRGKQMEFEWRGQGIFLTLESAEDCVYVHDHQSLQ